MVVDFASLKGNETVYDLYTGTGTIANYIAPKCRKVVGVEQIPEAIEDARRNSRLNGISNTSFFSGDMKDVLTGDFCIKNGVPEVIILDPPRAGIHDKVIRALIEVSPSRIVYVSCNPATQAKDINFLLENYSVEKIQPVDMFPHTHHVENVIALGKK